MWAECDPIYRYSLYSYRIILYIRDSGNRSLGSDGLGVKKKIIVFPVTRPTLIFCCDPKVFIAFEDKMP